MNRFTLLSALALSGCALQPPTYTQSNDLTRYRYVVIENTSSIASISASGGDVSTRYVNPSQLIEGRLLKKGLIKINEPTPQTAGKLLIMKWGISGKRDLAGGAGGYAQEVTISLIDADTLESIYTCSAEGIGSTEADDIREAITNCMSGLK